MIDIRDGTGSGVIQFIEYIASKGPMKSNAAASYRAAASKVLKIDGDAWKTIDIKHLDVDQQLARFETVSGTNCTPSSLVTYRTRFRRSVEMYMDYLESPSSFKPQLQSRRTHPKPLPNDLGRSEKSITEETRPTAPSQTPELIEYPFPLTTGETAYLRLPRNFTALDVERLTSFIGSIGIDPDTQPSGDA